MQKYLSMCDKVPLVVILGCTGAGKSQLALELARSFNGEIISADAMQMYKGLNVITNKVTEEEQKQVKHHMISVLESTDHKTVVDFRNTALPLIEDLMSQGKIPFICGGTNYYIESLLWKVLVDKDIGKDITSSKRKSYEDNPETINKKIKNVDDNYDNDENDKENEVIEDGLREKICEKDDGSIELEVLWQRLKQIDPERAAQLHPNARRKIWRSLQVWEQHGVKHSDVLAAQVEEGQGALGGGLRFPLNRICIIEVWSDKDTLDHRCDRRVDKMIQRGLVQELTDFHKSYNENRRLNSEGDSDYTTGIFQSIGFKEFHNYLLLNPEEKETDKGKEEFKKGVELLKIATRQYARRQAKWMRRRFVVSNREVPPVYRVDSSKPELWQTQCYQPAQQILQAFMDGKEPEMKPLERISLDESDFEKNKKKFICDLCNKEFIGSTSFQGHINGKRHKHEVKQQHQQHEVGKVVSKELPVAIQLCSYNTEKRKESARILKSNFTRPLSFILEKMDNMPALLCKLKSKSEAENVVKSLAKHDIIVEILPASSEPSTQGEREESSRVQGWGN